MSGESQDYLRRRPCQYSAALASLRAMHLRRAYAAALALLSVSCGSSPPSSPTAPQAVLSVGGSYTVTKAYVDTGCGTDLASLSASILVEHTPGSTSFTIRESFMTYHGRVSPDGRFETEDLVPEHDPPLRITLRDGRFSATGLEARNVWEMFRNGASAPATCSGALSYSGRRVTGTNTFP